MSETITNAHHIPKDVGGGIFKYTFFCKTNNNQKPGCSLHFGASDCFMHFVFLCTLECDVWMSQGDTVWERRVSAQLVAEARGRR